jgi:RHS repeat-associated protein
MSKQTTLRSALKVSYFFFGFALTLISHASRAQDAPLVEISGESVSPGAEGSGTPTAVNASAGAQTAAASTGGGSGRAGTPGGDSSVPGANDLLAFQTDLFTGRFSYSVPIVVAPGRQGADPKLALAYNSGAANGWCGVGWSLEVGYIERETKKGVPVKWGTREPLNEYDDSAGFVFNLGGANGSLVNIGGSDYRNEIDREFLTFKFQGSYYWEVTDKSGAKFFFGQTPESRMEHPDTSWTTNLSKSTFRWALNRIVDANGNETTLNYSLFDNYLYLAKITYNGNTNGGVSATHTVDFVLGSGRADHPLSFRSNYRVQLKKRLSEIIVKANGQRVRRYDLVYTNSPSTFRSLLQSVVLYGSDDTSYLPPLTFTYQVKPFGFDSAINWTGVDAQGGGEAWATIKSTLKGPNDVRQTFVDLADIDGDALPDRITRTGTSPYDRYLAQRNTGSAFAPVRAWGRLTSQSQTTSDWGSLERVDENYVTQLRLMDINGDGYPDRVMDALGSDDRFIVETNTGLQGVPGSFYEPGMHWEPLQIEAGSGYGWFAVSTPLVFTNGLQYVVTDLLDINGDGLPDRVMRKNDPYYTYFVVQHNTGSGFSGWRRHKTLLSQGQIDKESWSGIAGVYSTVHEIDQDEFETDTQRFLMMKDMNGDGLPDRVMRKVNTPFDSLVVQYNRGVDFANLEDNFGPIDGQGADSDTETGWYCPQSTYYAPSGGDTAVQCTLVDMNGDGLPDRVMRKRDSPYTHFKVQFNTGSGFTATTNFGPIAQNTTWFWASSQWVDQLDSFNLTKVDLVDINGDGLPDRVWYASPSWGVELNKGPFPDLLSKIDNGIGGKVDVTYVPSTQFNNRDKDFPSGDPWAEGAKSLLPFVTYVVETVATRDGLGNSQKTTYSYRGGMYDAKRREFRGFNRATMEDKLGTITKVFFHQGGGRDETADGEYQDAGSAAKKGIPYRIVKIGTNGLTYSVTINKVEEAQLHANGWCFPYISQSIQMEYEGLSNYRAVAQQFIFDNATGNLLTVRNFGEVTNINTATHTFTDVGSDSVYTHTAYTNLVEIKSKPSSVKITSDDAGTLKLRETLFAYDARGNLTSQQSWLSNSVYITTASIAYDQYGNAIRATDAAGITTTNTYDSTYQTFLEQKVTGGFTNQFRYNPGSGSLLLAIDPNGVVSSNVYDVFFRPTETWVSTNAAGTQFLWKEKFSYNLGGISTDVSYNYVRHRVNDEVDAVNGHETYNYADGLGRTIQTRVEAETNGWFRVTDAFFDERGNPLFTTLPYFSSGSGFTITTGTRIGAYTECDAIGRAFKVTPAVEAVFDSNGNFTDIYGTGGDTGSPVAATITDFKDGSNPWVTVATDAEGKVTKSYQDAYGRTIQVSEVTSGGTYNTIYRYDLVGNLTNVTDHALNVTRIAYDNLGRKTSMVDPDMGAWIYCYDNASRLVQQIDAKGQKLEFVYTNDPAGRLTARKIYNTNGILVATITYVYDTNQGESAYTVSKGQLFKVTDREGWTKFGYDLRGRMTNTTRHLNINNAEYTTQLEYDDADRVKTVLYPTASQTRIKYVYDTAGHTREVFSLAGTGTGETFYSLPRFNELNQITSQKYGTNQQVSYEFYAKSKRAKAKTVTVATNLQALTYEYDKVSNLKKITDGSRPSGTNSATITSFTYDDLHRLTQLNSAALGIRNYAYNPIGNMITNGDFGAGAYSYSANKAHAASSANGKNYYYDACGNMTIRDIQTLQYDEENRLVRVDCPSPTITFGYADDGTRLWRNSTSLGLTIWIGGIYEVRGTKPLCHVFVNGQLISSFEPQGGLFGFIPRTPTVARLASTAERWFAWPLQSGRAPVTLCVVTLFGILCASVFGRWSEVLHRGQRRGKLAMLWALVCYSLPLRPFVRPSAPSSILALPPSLDVPRSAFRAPRFWHQALSVWLIVGLVLATTETNVQAQVYPPVFYYYHPDHLGSSNILTDRNGVIVQQYEYTAYGKERVRTSAAAFSVTHRYTGQELDEETGLYFYQSRYYDPELGRFIQPDSTVPDEENPQALNRYSYAYNNPYVYTDPSGESPFLDFAEMAYSAYDVFANSSFNAEYNASTYSNGFATEYGVFTFSYNGISYGGWAQASGYYGQVASGEYQLATSSGGYPSTSGRRSYGTQLQLTDTVPMVDLASLSPPAPAAPAAVETSSRTLTNVATVAGLASMIPGPVGTAAGLVEAGAHAAQGKWGEAAWAGGAALAGMIGAAGIVKGIKAWKALKTGTQLEFQFAKELPDVSYLYQKVGGRGEHLKFGVTENPATRYTKAELKGGKLTVIAHGERSEMLSLERQLHETLPIGREEGQKVYIQMQVKKGLKPPPY